MFILDKLAFPGYQKNTDTLSGHIVSNLCDHIKMSNGTTSNPYLFNANYTKFTVPINDSYSFPCSLKSASLFIR